MLYIILLITYVVIVAIIVVVCYTWKNKKYKETTYYKVTNKPYFSVKRNLGTFGEYLIYQALRHYEVTAKFLFNCYLPKGNGETTEIDVLMIHPAGIFVFESKNYSGWIFGNERSKMWTQTLPQGRGRAHKQHFFNPIMQNKLHIQCLVDYLKNNSIPTYSIIVFSERCTLKKIEIHSPTIKVINRNHVNYTVKEIINSSPPCLSEEECNHIYNLLFPLSQVSDAKKQKHINDIQNRL